MKFAYNSILLGLCSLVIGCTSSQETKSFDLVLKNAQIIDEQGHFWSTQKNIYINSDTIALITSTDSLFAAKVETEIDAVGHFVLPGFWDNHVHFRGSESLIAQNEKFLAEYLKYGITTVRDAGGDLTTHVQQWNRETANGNRRGPTIYTSGPKLDGKNARWAGSLEVTDNISLMAAIDSIQRLDADYIKLYDSTLSRKNYLDIIREAEKRSIITSGHMPFTVELNEALDAGLDNIEHLYYVLKGCSSKEAEITQQIQEGTLGFWESMSQLIATYDPVTAQNTFAKLKAKNTFVTPTLHIGEILSYLDEIDHSQDAFLKQLDTAFIATYEGRVKGALSASAKAKKDRKELQQFFKKLANSLQNAGVSLLAGSDNGAYNSYVYPGISLHLELEQMVKAGLTPAEALRTSSLNGATFLKKNDYGIHQGAKADFVLLKQNPLKDIRNSKTIHKVIKNGKEVFGTQL